MSNILSCFVIFFLRFGVITPPTQGYVIVGSDHNLVFFCSDSETENGFFSITANAAKRRQFAHLVAMRNQIQERPNAFFLKVSVQPTRVHSLARIHKLQYAQDVGKELALVDQQHIRRRHIRRVLGFQFFNRAAHDAGDHGAVVRGKQRIFGRSVARVSDIVDNHHAHVAKRALLVHVGEPRGFS